MTTKTTNKKPPRKSIPKELEIGVIYKCANTCCVCRIRNKPVQIHHLDQNPSNNIEKNLIALCTECHNEAHTKRELARNLTIPVLNGLKEKWECEVKENSAKGLIESESSLSSVIWTYINLTKIPKLMDAFGVAFDEMYYRQLLNRKAIDKSGIPILGPKVDEEWITTLYDRMEHDASMRFHQMYSDVVDKIILSSHPIILTEIWTKTGVKALVKPGTICFCSRGFIFKRGARVNGDEERMVFAKSKGVKIEMIINTKFMYGSSAVSGSFLGSKTTTILMYVKDVSIVEGTTIISASPIAMGTGISIRPDYYPYGGYLMRNPIAAKNMLHAIDANE